MKDGSNSFRLTNFLPSLMDRQLPTPNIDRVLGSPAAIESALQSTWYGIGPHRLSEMVLRLLLMDLDRLLGILLVKDSAMSLK